MGADSVIPFSGGGTIQAYALFTKYDPGVKAGWDCLNTDGTHSQGNYNTNTPAQLVAASELISASERDKVTIGKAGYYTVFLPSTNTFSVSQYTVGQKVSTNDPYMFALIYLGNTNPFA